MRLVSGIKQAGASSRSGLWRISDGPRIIDGQLILRGSVLLTMITRGVTIVFRDQEF